VAGVNPVTELTKLPAPVPSAVFASVNVGEPFVFQHTPRAITAAPPSVVIVPPQLTVAELTEEMAAVVIPESVAVVVIFNSPLYDVPMLFVA